MSPQPSPSQNKPHVDRRQFLGRTSAAGLAGAGLAALPASSYAKVIGANDRIRVGFIGVGGMGSGHLGAIKSLKESNNLEPIAVADCWKKRAEEGAQTVGAPNALTDYRKLLARDDIDYVTIATPEHWHAQMTIEALDSGKAVYCEKPMTHRIPEALAVAAKQKETGLALQVGVQGMSDDSYSSAAKAIEEGLLGQVVQAQIEYVRRYNQQGPWRNPDINDATPQPADLDWNAWLGKAPKCDWNPHHYFEWRNYSQYSGGICTDLFIHRITRIMKACKLLYPRRVVGMGGIWQWPDGRDLPDNFEMICEYPRGMTVYVLGTMSNRVGMDHLIRGYRATLYFTGSGWVAKDKDGKVLAEHKKTGGEDIRLHHTNLHNHLRNGEQLNCPVELGLAGVVAVNMANESWATGQMMGWDTKNQRMAPANTLDLGHEPEPA
ncbi:MAG: Gfo/Idh/MocA family oxidoreductase [Planctomycetales bacterium]|nr:Gfo/Idh/MocA family oxidoreductase [Planctomycetales bacterium]